MSKKWWDDVEFLIRKVKGLYKRLEEKGKSGWVQASVIKIIKERNWGQVEDLIKPNLTKCVSDHTIMYVPKGFEPGPRFVFPQYDLNDVAMKAQTKPLGEDGAKYWIAGDRDNFLGPSWLGNSNEMLARIQKLGYVLVVEGTFDFVAVRALNADIPVLCSLTKKIGRKQEAYLQMLGVKTLYLMFDQDPVGIEAMTIVARTFKSMTVEIVKTPGKDASLALENRKHALILRDTLRRIIDKNESVMATNITILEEEE
jgi:hypothetical protein